MGCIINKLSYFNGVATMPNTWQPQHVNEITNYLWQRGYVFNCYKEMQTSNYILEIDNLVIRFNRASAICEYLIDFYFEEKKEEERTILEERKKRMLKNEYFKKGVYYGK